MLEEGQGEWGKERVMGERGGGETRKKQKEKGKKERQIGGRGRGRKRWGNKGKSVYGCGDCGREAKRESKGKNCRSNTRGKGKDMEGRRGITTLEGIT